MMVNAGYQYPLIREFTTSDSHRIALTDRRITAWSLSATPTAWCAAVSWEIGLSKTGYISEAGRCLVMQATIAAKPVIIVLLDSWGKLSRDCRCQPHQALGGRPRVRCTSQSACASRDWVNRPHRRKLRQAAASSGGCFFMESAATTRYHSSRRADAVCVCWSRHWIFRSILA